MLLSEAAQYIKSTVPTAAVISLYGYSLNREGFMSCPFHGERTPSLKVYDARPSASRHGWYCFGCHAGGSVIDFVMRHDGCDFATAVRAIDHALSLNLLAVESWQDQEEYRQRQKWLDEEEKMLLTELDEKAEKLQLSLRNDYQSWASIDQIPKQNRTAEEWTRWYNLREGMLFQEDKLAILESRRKEVHSWRNNQRLRQSRKADSRR